MKLNARLTVIDGRVACPASGGWEEVGHCADCSEFKRTDGPAQAQTVVCTPEAESLAAAMDAIARV